jgi:hypothetical protein
MDLRDATLMLLIESQGHPELAGRAQSAYNALADGADIPWAVLSDLIGEASGKAVLRTLHRKYSATEFEAIVGPILREIDRQKPVPPRRRPAPDRDVPDPLTAADWPGARQAS